MNPIQENVIHPRRPGLRPRHGRIPQALPISPTPLPDPASLSIERPVSILKKRKDRDAHSTTQAKQRRIAFTNVANQVFEIPNCECAERANLESLLEIFEANPNDIHAAGQLGNYYFDLEEYDEALSYFTRITEIDPSDVSARISIGEIYAEEEDYLEAVAQLRIALRIDPKDRRIYRKLSEIYRELTLTDEADRIDEVLRGLREEQRQNSSSSRPTLRWKRT